MPPFIALSAHMIQADIVLETPRNERILVVECKWMKAPSLERAAELRDSLSPLWTTDYEFFLLVLRTGLHLWRREAPSGSAPDFTAPAKRLWGDYLGKLAENPDHLRSESMERAVASWLSDLASNVRKPDPASEPDQLLLNSGLYGRMQNGLVRLHVEA
jgi:hypothetical protein